MWRVSRLDWKLSEPGVPGALSAVGLGAELADDQHLAREGGAQAHEPGVDGRLHGGRRGERVVVPALVVGGAHGVDVAVHEARPVGHVRAPDVDRGRAARDRGGARAGRRRRRTRAGRRSGRCRRPRWRGSRPRRWGAGAPAATFRRTRRIARRCCTGVREVHAPGASTGPTPCQTRIPAASRRSSSASLSGCWLRVALAPMAFSRATIASASASVSASPRPGRVLLQRGAAQLQRLAVELQAPARPAHLAQADARGEDRLAGDLEAQPLERRVARLPELGARDAHARVDRGALRRERDGPGEAHRGAGERPAHGDGPRAGAVGDADREVDHRVGAVQVRDDRRRVELAGPELADRDRAVDAAEVEPGAMPGVGLHRRRIAPVGAHDERVRRRRSGARGPRRAGRSRCAASRSARRPTRRPCG